MGTINSKLAPDEDVEAVTRPTARYGPGPAGPISVTGCRTGRLPDGLQAYHIRGSLIESRGQGYIPGTDGCPTTPGRAGRPPSLFQRFAPAMAVALCGLIAFMEPCLWNMAGSSGAYRLLNLPNHRLLPPSSLHRPSATVCLARSAGGIGGSGGDQKEATAIKVGQRLELHIDSLVIGGGSDNEMRPLRESFEEWCACRQGAGSGLAKVNGKVVFVSSGIPGSVVMAMMSTEQAFMADALARSWPKSPP
eukprot:765044-Hanusia_phi.AAC.1